MKGRVNEIRRVPNDSSASASDTPEGLQTKDVDSVEES